MGVESTAGSARAGPRLLPVRPTSMAPASSGPLQQVRPLPGALPDQRRPERAAGVQDGGEGSRTSPAVLWGQEREDRARSQPSPPPTPAVPSQRPPPSQQGAPEQACRWNPQLCFLVLLAGEVRAVSSEFPLEIN